MTPSAAISLGSARPGQSGTIIGVETSHDRDAPLTADERLRRLLEFGFVEGARVEVLHAGLVGGDPIAVRVDDTRIALRRALADAVLVRLD
jgi:ferrous iron transport protein A